ncbi:MAG: DUF1850 domain-containing protein [Candidatus Rokubacteria bacterium]|nr:DUF1850 domain-containing protein [Candidatus Rokubacteria bacterium]
MRERGSASQSGLRGLPLALLLGGAALVLLGWFLLRPLPILTVTEAGSGALLRLPVRADETFTLSYIHSVERVPVTGTFAIGRDGRLEVLETAFGSFGPGLPEPRPGEDYELRGGMIHYRPGGQALEVLSFFVHPFTDHRLTVGGRTLELSRLLPPGSRVVVRVDPVPAYRTLFP